MQFSFEQLLAFVTVYDVHSFSKAAAKLSKHRTTIGQVITNLEDLLAVRLFERVGRSVEPTEDAHLLYHYAKQTIEQARTFDKVALSLAYGGLENINIAYSSVIPHNFLVLIRMQLAVDFPMMRVNFLVRNKSEIKQGLQSGEYHFGLVNVHDSQAMHSLDSTFLGHFEFLPFVQKNGDLAALAPDEVLMALRNSKQFVLRSLLQEGMSEKNHCQFQLRRSGPTRLDHQNGRSRVRVVYSAENVRSFGILGSRYPASEYIGHVRGVQIGGGALVPAIQADQRSEAVDH